MRFLFWSGREDWDDGWHAETARIELGDGSLRATGAQFGIEPAAYRLTYRLEAPRDYVTSELELAASGAGWQRRLLLRRDGDGRWNAAHATEGQPPFPEAGGQLPDLAEALDCDLAHSPLTNSMPVLRHRLDQGGSRDFLMAWVSVPDLAVLASAQRYEHVRTREEGSVVRYISLDSDFIAELELDANGLVELYPGLARRVGEATA